MRQRGFVLVCVLGGALVRDGGCWQQVLSVWQGKTPFQHAEPSNAGDVAMWLG